jgi:RNA polymerase sigma-70 factor (ECF subfamily)
MSQRPSQRSTSALSGEQAARLSTLFETHADRLYRLARRLVPSADDALDLVQETFLRAARSPESIPRGSSNEEAWLVRVLINIRRDAWRKEAFRTDHALELSHAAVSEGDPERTFVIRVTVWRALDHLSPRRRAVLVMYELEGLSMKSIASLLGINAITVRWHLSRARRELGRRLRLELGESDEQSQNALADHRPAPSRSSAP